MASAQMRMVTLVAEGAPPFVRLELWIALHDALEVALVLLEGGEVRLQVVDVNVRRVEGGAQGLAPGLEGVVQEVGE